VARVAAPFLLLLITSGFYWKLTLTGHYTWVDHPDMAYIEVPRLGFQAREIHAGRFPLWDPHLWAGQPLVGQTQPGPLYPLNLLLYLMPLRDGYLDLRYLNWYFIAVHFLAALFCYWLAQDLGRSRAASIAAGCAFSFGGFLGTVPWLDVMNGAVWTPLVCLFLLRAVRGERPAANAALSGLFAGLSWLAGHHEIPMLVALAAAATWLFYVFRRGRPDWRLAGAAAVFALVAGLTSAVQTWPTYEFGRRAHRWVGDGYQSVTWKDAVPYGVHTFYSMPARGLLDLALPTENRYADTSLYLGVVVAALAALGFAAGWREPAVRWLAVVAVGAALYSLGAHTPLHKILYSVVPLLDRARIPVRAFHLLNFGLAALAARGFDALLAGPRKRWTRWLALALGGLMFFELSQIAPGGLASRSDTSRNQYASALRGDRDIADFLRAQPGPVRAAVNDQDLPMNFGDWHGIDMLQGYVAGVTSNVARHELHSRRTQMLFGVTHAVGRKPDRPDQELVFEGARGVNVYRNPDPLPRAWIVHQAVAASSDHDLRVMIQDPAFDLGRKVILLGEVPALEACAGGDQARIVKHESDRVTLSARLACRGMVVLSESYFRGWRATVDGRPARLYEAYGALRGVVVDAGEHTIEMKYRPVSVYGGAALTALGLLLAAVVRWRNR